ncbi:MAG TPA: hypothetical protein PKX56_03175 [Marmoricola sp.]|nr:hypothetical protein [Marmoricola sp.]HNJ78333.1 hypothetical protein [Marmoricola sp.]HNN47838.1 hypothetical protein [Marmoricola sp.]HNO39843.1 hypothetical protein [Marmoricola sp.]
MTDDNVGSVGEEAAKLLGALGDWAKSQSDGHSENVAGLASGLNDKLQDINQHLATDAAECKYCPICRVVHVVRSASPEVRDNLLLAATALMQAGAAFLATQTPRQEPRSGVEHIDLDDEEDS